MTRFAIAAALSLFLVAHSAHGAGAELIEVKKIWDQAPHNAFTGLVKWNGAWYCVFREGSGHIPGVDGKIRVLRSTDGAKWESAALIAEKAVDLRDPKICVAPDERLMIVMGGSIYAGAEPTPGRAFKDAHSRVSFSKDGAQWSAPQPVEGIGDQQWLWRVTWHKGVGYGAVYATKVKGSKQIALTIWKTADGVKYEKIAEPTPTCNPSEATIRFLADDTMVLLVRGEQNDRRDSIGVSKPPYEKWEWKDAGRMAHGPDFVVTANGTMFYAGRDFDEKGAARTVFGRMTTEKLEPLVTLPSSGDTSYPGIVDEGGGVFRVSYYSSHEGKTAIYLAKVKVNADAR